MYLNDPSIRGLEDEFEYDEEMIDELRKCKKSPIYFIENYIKIISESKLITFKLRQYQKDYINALHSNTRVLVMYPRQSGKSITTAAYIAWYVIFNENIKTLLLADQQDKAVEQLLRIKEMIQELPLWMQQGVKKWNEKRIMFSNKSEIRASATQKKAARGFTVNFMYLDEFAFVESHVAKEFMSSVFPTVASDPNAKIAITSTPKGLNFFWEMWMKSEKKREEGALKRDDFRTLTIPWNAVPGRDEAFKQAKIEELGSEVIFNQEYNCIFEGSVATLVDAIYIKEIERQYGQYPVQMLEDRKLRIFSWPVREASLKEYNWEYLITVDPAMGTKQDFTVAQVWLIKSNTDIEQVAIYQSNDVEPINFVGKILALCKMYHSPNVIVETMEPAGGVIIGSLMNENNYYNVINMQKEGFGVRLHHEAKIRACTLMQVYCEKLLLKIRDAATLKELSMFGKKGNTYKAISTDTHDDLIMSTLLMLHYVNSNYFYGNIDEESIYRKKSTILSTNVDKSDPLIKEALDRMMVADIDSGNTYGNIPMILTGVNRKFEDATRWKEPSSMANQKNNPMLNPHANGNAYWHMKNGY